MQRNEKSIFQGQLTIGRDLGDRSMRVHPQEGIKIATSGVVRIGTW